MSAQTKGVRDRHTLSSTEGVNPTHTPEEGHETPAPEGSASSPDPGGVTSDDTPEDEGRNSDSSQNSVNPDESPDSVNSEGFTDQQWCEECRIGRCVGEHSGFSRFTPATGGGARETFLGTDDALQVPCASVTPMFVEGTQFADADDAPYVALSVTAGAVSLRAHEARQLAAWLIRTAGLIEVDSA